MPQKSLTKFYEDESASAALFNLPLNDADDNFAELYAAVGAAGDMKKADYDDDDDKIVEAAEFSGESAALVGEMLSYSAYDISALDGRIIELEGQVIIGEEKVIWRVDVPDGWLLEDGKTIGDAASGGTALASPDTEILFALLWEAVDNISLPIQNSNGTPGTRGANAAADYAAHKRLPLPNPAGLSAIGYGVGWEYTYALGEQGGTDGVVLGDSDIPLSIPRQGNTLQYTTTFAAGVNLNHGLCRNDVSALEQGAHENRPPYLARKFIVRYKF
jgi:hypothetical protein